MPASLVAWYRWRMTVTIGRQELLAALGGVAAHGAGAAARDAGDRLPPHHIAMPRLGLSRRVWPRSSRA